ILKAFEATSISPLDANIILKRFINTSPEQTSGETSGSDISASDWRKIQRVLKGEVKDETNRQARKLSQVIHRLSVQNQLYKHEN
ncbi:hypothetical protein EJ02DRAFT_347914, partial [Clathrospora elynae]